MTRWLPWHMQSHNGKRLAEMYGVYDELKAVGSACERMLRMRSLTRPTAEKSEDVWALWWYSVMRYRRCFYGGKRAPVPATLVDALTQDQRDFHDFTRKLRNEFLAHAGKRFELYSSGVLLDETRTKRGPMWVSATMLLMPDRQLVQRLRQLAGTFERALVPELKATEDRFEAEIEKVARKRPLKLTSDFPVQLGHGHHEMVRRVISNSRPRTRPTWRFHYVTAALPKLPAPRRKAAKPRKSSRTAKATR